MPTPAAGAASGAPRRYVPISGGLRAHRMQSMSSRIEWLIEDYCNQYTLLVNLGAKRARRAGPVH